ncbi:MAG: hypothetical protein EOM47_06500 [Bacteroidia bacterium]|nr:hypothetical protein [Bacteroidia bacterium]
MITFNETSFTVEVHTGCLPVDNYVGTINDIIDVLQASNTDMRGAQNYYYLLELLRAMIPDEEQAKKLSA